jgi:ribosome recycling factor
VIETAKEYASKKQTSVSEIVETYLKKLVARDKEKEYASDKLVGILKSYKNLTDEEVKTLYLKGKHDA